MDKVQCPVCGNMVAPEQIDIMENGNPACHCCAEKEKEKQNL